MPLRQVPERPFSSGTYRYVCGLATDPDALRSRFDIHFEENHQAQLAPELFSVVELSSGEMLWFIYHPAGHPDSLDILADGNADIRRCRQQLLRDLALTEADLAWKPDEA